VLIIYALKGPEVNNFTKNGKIKTGSKDLLYFLGD